MIPKEFHRLYVCTFQKQPRRTIGVFSHNEFKDAARDMGYSRDESKYIATESQLEGISKHWHEDPEIGFNLLAINIKDMKVYMAARQRGLI